MNDSMVFSTLLLTLVLTLSSFLVHSPMGIYKPVPLMLLIFASYNVVPFLVVCTFPELAQLMLLGSFSYYSSDNIFIVALLSLACVVAGLAGLLLASYNLVKWRNPKKGIFRIESKRTENRRFFLGTTVFSFIFLVSCVLLWNLKESLFSGYHEAFGEDINEVLMRGSLSSLFTLLFISYLLTWFTNEQRSASSQRKPRLFWYATLGLLLVGLALLSMGGRLYIVSAIITLLALKGMQSSFVAKTSISIWSLLGFAGLLLGLVAIVGLWRNQSEFNALAILKNLIAEPLYISISLASLYSENNVPALDFPLLLLNDTVGMLPSFIYPEKIERFFAIKSIYKVDSPSGGLSGLASLSANFGWLGAIVISGLICYLVARLSFSVSCPKKLSKYRVVFVIAATFPLLSLCRDPFVISVYKNLLQNSVLWPIAVALAIQLVISQNPTQQIVV